MNEIDSISPLPFSFFPPWPHQPTETDAGRFTITRVYGVRNDVVMRDGRLDAIHVTIISKRERSWRSVFKVFINYCYFTQILTTGNQQQI